MNQTTVHAVIPVFNRLALTRQCIRRLQAQTYQSLSIIVADGGSSDGTPEAIRREFPDVIVLTSEKELWWAGAMALGIDHVLNTSANPDDFVLMMNNDTEFDSDFVEVLVRVARTEGAAVGALTVDVRDPSVILDAGEFIDWRNYAFPVKTTVEPGETFFDAVDVLPGRGTLVPIRMIREAGNVNSARFPHYIADYEFFARVKRRGFRLGVTYETTIRSDPTITGLAARPGGRSSFFEAIRLQLSRRSMNNFFDHYRFIDVAAPPEIKAHVKQRFVRRLIGNVLLRLKVLWLAQILKRIWLLAVMRPYKAASWYLLPPFYVSSKEISLAQVDVNALVNQSILVPFQSTSKEEGFYFTRRSVNAFRASDTAIRALLESAQRNGKRLPRRVVCQIVASRLRLLGSEDPISSSKKG